MSKPKGSRKSYEAYASNQKYQSVIAMLADGCSIRQAASFVSISTNTVLKLKKIFGL